jgi:hypothetical protein
VPVSPEHSGCHLPSLPIFSLGRCCQHFRSIARRFGLHKAWIGHVVARLNTFLEETQADELMVVANTYKFEDRLRSYELLSNLAEQVREEPQIAKTVKV